MLTETSSTWLRVLSFDQNLVNIVHFKSRRWRIFSPFSNIDVIENWEGGASSSPDYGKEQIPAYCSQIMKRSFVKVNDYLISHVKVTRVSNQFISTEKTYYFYVELLNFFFVALRQFQANLNRRIYELENKSYFKIAAMLFGTTNFQILVKSKSQRRFFQGKL